MAGYSLWVCKMSDMTEYMESVCNMWFLPHHHQQLEECPQADHTPCNLHPNVAFKNHCQQGVPGLLA